MNTHIFLIDDDPMQLRLGEFLLGKHQPKATCTSFTNGAIAIEYLTSHHLENELLPDLILLDLDMPQLSGWAFLHLFAKLETFIKKDISVVIVSSSADYKAKTLLNRYKFVKGVYLKPLTAEILDVITGVAGLGVEPDRQKKRKYI